jgi:hypothetical protein
MHRRGFLISAMAAGAAAPASAQTPADVVFETGAPAAVAFADAARKAGAQAHAIAGDMTEVWFTQLQPRWANAPFPVAGLTFYPALFCLERLAWDHGLRLAAYASHGRPHRVELAASPLRLQAALQAAGSLWPQRLAAALLDPTIGRPGRPSTPPFNSKDLVSWLIAPR